MADVEGVEIPDRRPGHHHVPRRPAPPSDPGRRPHPPAGRGSTTRVVVLVDDVLYSGRTVRAALDALGDIGRPRGGPARRAGRSRTPPAADPGRPRRQEPARPRSGERVRVRLEEVDGVNEVTIVRRRDRHRPGTDTIASMETA